MSVPRDLMSHVAAVRYRFVPRPAHDTPDINLLVPDDQQYSAIAHREGPLLVRGGPGTGKTTTLIEAVAARVSEGVDCERILVLGFGRRGAKMLRHNISVRLGVNGTEVPTFSFAAYAFAILRLAAARRHQAAPQLLKGPEQDVIIRDLLANDVVQWPPEIQPALTTRAFATQLRDLLLRVTERGLSAAQLAAFGHQYDRPEWITAAEFMSKYVDVLAVRSLIGGASYDSAEIVRAAATELADQPDLIAKPSYVFVDELQDTDPAQWELLRHIAGDGAKLIAFGDTDSATYGFRGGDSTIMHDFCERFTTVDGRPAPAIDLATCYRSAKAPLAASSSVAQHLRGTAKSKRRRTRDEIGDGAVTATTLRSATQQAAYITAQLRRAHLIDNIAWSDMAVIVKSAAEHLPLIAQSLRHAEVPIEIAANDQALSQKPIVRQLLTIIQCGVDPKLLDEDTAVSLLHSSFGGADALLERRLRQELRQLASQGDIFRSAGELLVAALRDPTELHALPDEPWATPPRRIAALLERARTTVGTVEDVLWAVWDDANLAPKLSSRAVSGDARAQNADDMLDAVMTLFDWAADFTDRLPGADAAAFATQVLQQILPSDTLAAHANRGDCVQLLTAHSAKGRQWDLVVIAGVQEGHWPNLRPRGSLLGAEYLVEAFNNDNAADVDTMSVLINEERRLFHVACSRARDRLVVTCVSDDDDNQPSRFIDELGVEPDAPTTVDAALTLPSLVAKLRIAACDPQSRDRDAAIAQLARLADAGVPGADPTDWWGLRPLSDERPLTLPGEKLRVRPSSIELMDQCGLRWVLEKHGGNEPSGIHQQIGNLVHAAAEAAAHLPVSQQHAAMTEFIQRHVNTLPSQAPWIASRDRRELQDITNNYLAWVDHNERRFVAAERAFRVDLPSGDTGASLQLSGIVDRLEQDLRGGVHVVDLKTGRVPPTNIEAASNPQMAAYQLAVERGGFADICADTTPAGASLVYVRQSNKTTGATVRLQNPPTESAAEDAQQRVVSAAQAMTRSTFDAVHTSKCDSCGVRQCCPISGEGTAVTE